MGDAAVDAVKAVAVHNAGTFEFLLDEDGNFYFIEVNTRIQVEHPVTELVTGIDLVKEQIRIAAGERLSFKQERHRVHGATRSSAGSTPRTRETFAPSPGRDPRRSACRAVPACASTRSSHAECTVPPYYDSMIAKIIVHGRDRAARRSPACAARSR